MAGRADWHRHVPGAPALEDTAKWNAYARDLGRAFAQLHYAWECDGRGLAVVLARPAGDALAPPPPMLHVMVDTRFSGHVPPAPAMVSDDTVSALVDALARGAYVPLNNDCDVQAPRAMADAFAAGYKDEAARFRRADVAERVLKAATLLD
jgi:hypothetical protein